MTAVAANKASNKSFNKNRGSNRGSKYAKKNKGVAPLPPVKRDAPVFLYFVEGTDVQAKKTPCERDRAATKDKPSQSTLGHWRDPRTNRPCKVTRVRNKQEEVAGAEGAAAA
jgi:hypothetical protein